ncbi:AAA family ATPase [Candidatus Woesearchaeota archaeon]|nr:AAA family ATPase [Candidatus Woesearchaeota archaeon]
MIIHSLRLRNIRSYVDETINFPNGSVLLSGDIGGGKTSILLAIEFAIFGIMKGLVSGSSLLRHGARDGGVELSFSIGKDQVFIKRSLKRASNGIGQESGELIINNVSFEGTPQELKARILELIGYPEELLSKSKSLIFRYTVFTPQEEMKKILYENREERLDVLRRLFNIDKYKRVKENALTYVKELKGRASVLDGKLESLPDKKKELEDYDKQSGVLKSELAEKEKDLVKIKHDFEAAQKEFNALEKELEELKRLEKENAVGKNELNALTRQLERSEAELRRIIPLLEEMLKGLGGFDASKADEMKQLIERKKLELKNTEKQLSEVNTRRAENITKKNASNKIISEISKLDVCPTCKQKVTPEHLKEVIGREQLVITACDTNLSKLDEFEKMFSGKREAIEQEIDNYLKGERELSAMKARIEALDEKKERKKILEAEISELKDGVAKTNFRIREADALLEKQKDRKSEFEKAKRELDNKREEKYRLEKSVAEDKARLSTISQVVDRLKREIDKMKEEEKNLIKLNEVKEWLEKYFVNLTDTIEKNIMAMIYNEFNAFFQEWFSTLIEDETMSIRLDDYFSPIIEQNGYETWIDNLSGGEKTSVALAYRLALNKVINDFLSSIRTRDLIILDEPTEGFSSEQLDRVREVLNQTNVKQTIIVSHEAKMEGFVDHIIKIRKDGHESRVMKE